jgi:two-component system, OmpR family, phosphate regulon sensor histidine kinase PhoR
VCAVVDSGGRTVTGQRSRGYSAVRPASESQLPWTLYVAAAHPITQAGVIVRQRFLLLGTSVMVTFLILGTYFIARAIRRETETLRIQSDFVSAVSHEFRTPLTSLRQLTEMLALGRVSSEERRQLYYETLVKETTRLQRLIEGLLNFGRMEARARPYRFEELDASNLVHRVVAELEPQVTGAGRRIELSGMSAPCRIDADPDAISVALWNLLDNALKYSPDEPAVWVEWRMQDRFVAIAVRDKGRGITESERKAIFRKFVRGSAAEATNAKGSGVGLATVRYIVEAHGGGIMVESAPGQGSVFTMLLPAAGRV